MPSSRYGPIGWSVLLAVVGLVCMPVAPAGAADASVVGGELLIVDTAGETNIIDVVPSGPNAYYVVDQGPAIVPGPGCTALLAQIVQCELVAKIAVSAGGGDDLIGMQRVMVPVRALGGDGDDLLEAGATAAVMDGGEGIDSVVGGAAADMLTGGGGPDLLVGGRSADMLSGGNGDDILEATGGGADTLNGEGGRDLLRGGTGNETLNGGAGNDVIVSGAGRDNVSTGLGRDSVFAGGGSDATVACAPGDVVRADPGVRTTGCTASSAPATAKPPTRWPPEPQSATASQSARAAIVAPDPQVTSALRLPGDAEGFTVKVAETEDYPLKVRVYVYDAARRKVRQLVRTVRTMHASTFGLPANLRKKAALVVVKRLRG